MNRIREIHFIVLNIASDKVKNFLQFLLVLPIVSVEVEKGFSLMNLTRTDLRNRISDDLFEDIIIVKYHGLDWRYLPLHIIDKWVDNYINKKKRRYLY